MVIRGGENLYPREIEELLHSHPAIAEVNVRRVKGRVLDGVPRHHDLLPRSSPNPTRTAPHLLASGFWGPRRQIRGGALCMGQNMVRRAVSFGAVCRSCCRLGLESCRVSAPHG